MVPYLSDDLTLKSSEKGRTMIGVNFDEVMKIFSASMVCKIEDYLLQFVISPQIFDGYMRKAISLVKLGKLSGMLCYSFKKCVRN